LERPPGKKESDASGLAVEKGRAVPWSELTIRTSRSGGPGGQHVNKVETQVEVTWNLQESLAFTPREKARLRTVLGPRLSRAGVLRLRSRVARTQLGNRRAVLERLSRLLQDALQPPQLRSSTRPTRSSQEARLARKRRDARRKAERRRPEPDE